MSLGYSTHGRSPRKLPGFSQEECMNIIYTYSCTPGTVHVYYPMQGNATSLETPWAIVHIGRSPWKLPDF